MAFSNFPIQVGDRVIAHHNIFRRWYDVRGKERNGGNYIDEGLYYVNDSQVYAYDNGDGWKALPGYSFVEPIAEKFGEWDTGYELPLVGHIRYGHDQVGLEEGSLVGFSPGSEFEFNIEGKKLYRILLNDIIWTSKKNVNELLAQPS